jgi:hypothetical protein
MEQLARPRAMATRIGVPPGRRPCPSTTTPAGTSRSTTTITPLVAVLGWLAGGRLASCFTQMSFLFRDKLYLRVAYSAVYTYKNDSEQISYFARALSNASRSEPSHDRVSMSQRPTNSSFNLRSIRLVW